MSSGSDLWAVIPVAGSGTRLRPHTHTRPKPLLHVAGAPILGHILDQLPPAGIDKIVLIVGFMGNRIIDYVQSRRDFSRIESVEQKEMLGLGHAISLSQPVVGDSPLLMIYGDTVFRADLDAVLTTEHHGALGVKRVEDPRRFGIVVEENGRVKKLVEKPKTFVSDLAIVGVNYLHSGAELYRTLNKLINSGERTHGEFQVTDAFEHMVRDGVELGTFPVAEWFDCGTQEAMLETNRVLLEGRPKPEVGEDVVVLPPAHIDPSAQITSSVIGPHVSVGSGARVSGSVVRNSIIGEEAVVENIILEDSLVGFQAAVSGRYSHVNVGDLSQITS